MKSIGFVSFAPVSDCDQVPIEDLQNASETLTKALLLREKYMARSMQSFPGTTARFLWKLTGEANNFISNDAEEDVEVSNDDGQFGH